MSWRDGLGPASFRGVRFFVETNERSGGRRVVTHEFPFRDEPFVEDIGRKARTFPVEGYVLGADYLTARDALLTQLEKPGPGELVHPFIGTRQCIAVDFRVTESASEGGVARFSITFAETSANAPQPSIVADAASIATASAAVARDSVVAEFLATYAPGTFLGSLATSLGNAAAAITDAIAPLDLDSQSRAALTAQALAVVNGAQSLILIPEDIVSNMVDMFDAITDAGAALAVYAFDPGVRPPSATAARAIEQANYDALQHLVQRLAVVRVAELTVGAAFTSYEDAIAARDAVTDLIDEQADAAADDAYPALAQLRTDVVRAVPGSSSDLPHLAQYTPPVTVPSLVLAYRLYGSTSAEADLIARNRIAHPGYVPGGRPLEVLSDV